MILADYHFHSSFSSDSDTPLKDQLEAGIYEHGLKYMCVTDHLDYDWCEDPEGFDFMLDTDPYLKEVNELREAYKGKASIRTGVELGIQSQVKEDLEAFYAKYKDRLDFIIASTHLVEHMDPYYKDYFDRFKDKSILRYLEVTLDNLDVFTDFSVYGHLDYVARCSERFGIEYKPEEYMDIYDAILKKIISLGKGIEINTAGFKAGLSYAHPHPIVLKRYKDLGGEIITIGSDAHESKHIAYNFSAVPGILRDAGFKYYTVFEKLKPEFIKID